MQTIDFDKVNDVLIDVAATYILPRYNTLTSGEIDTKSGPNDLVTVADREAEEALTRILPDLYPGSVVIGEESISAGTATYAPLHEPDRMVWIVDPVDGTYNFVHGKREFGVILACAVNGQTRAGWIYDILGQRILTAEQGGGAYFEGQRLHLPTAAQSGQMAIDSIGFAGKKYFPEFVSKHLDENRDRVRGFKSLNCSAHEYINLATGQVDFGLYGMIKPWDHLAGALAVMEAGGAVRKWDMSPYNATDTRGGLIVANSPELMREIGNIFVKPIIEEM